jgi:ABC-type transport system involved in multi-copper enzyme maturation permease subunit
VTVLRTVAIGVRVTLFETLRRRTLWALIALTAIVVVLSGLGFHFLVSETRARGTTELELQLGVSQVLVLCAFMFSFILAATAAFIGAPAIAADIESGVLLAILARPIGRGAWLLGRWTGLAIVVAGYGVAAGLGEIAALRLVSGYGPPDPLGAAGGLAAQAVVVLTVTVLLGTRMPAIASGAVAVVLFGLAWGLGVLGGVGSALGVESLETVSRMVRIAFPSDGLWRATIFALEPGAVIALITEGRSLRVLQANPFFASTGPGPAFLGWCLVWVAGTLGLAILSFRRREL